MESVLGDLPSISILRIFRLIRIARVHRVIKAFPQLHLMIRGLAGAVMSIVWGLLLTALFITIYSILACLMIHPLNKDMAQNGFYADCERCPRAFESVELSFVTFFALTFFGEGWGDILPLIERYPAIGLYFILVAVTVQLALLNLVLAGIVDSAVEARKGSEKDIANDKTEARAKAEARLVTLCEYMDESGDGKLSLEELLNGYSDNEEFRNLLTTMDVQVDDMPIMFAIMDQDKSGDVDYYEFVSELHKMKAQDMQAMLVFIKFYVTDIRSQLGKQIEVLERDMLQNFSDLQTEEARIQQQEKAILQQLAMGAERTTPSPVSANIEIPQQGTDFSQSKTSTFLEPTSSMVQRDLLCKRLDDLREELLTKLENSARISENRIVGILSSHFDSISSVDTTPCKAGKVQMNNSPGSSWDSVSPYTNIELQAADRDFLESKVLPESCNRPINIHIEFEDATSHEQTMQNRPFGSLLLCSTEQDLANDTSPIGSI
eukprot:gnl/TRDRNA2_/TRDRNA2_171535_c1_seq3.p1 gnl/TRDRNA2_/TRDRNA2_171535_c1~~gnl/TRDRNA2_/TRDRNA2_171535_c1_seq3.p1  ORF type:complete len:566 (+),score=90.35 gnl/TRDRNA2_/TRDRNA2_171535_c1_seq3:225-1700(+)